MVYLEFEFAIFLVQLLGLLSLPVVGLAGIVLCLRHRSRPRRVRLAVGGAFVVQLIGYFVAPMVHSASFSAFSEGQTIIDPRIVIPRLFSSVISATALGLMLYAGLTRDDALSQVQERL